MAISVCMATYNGEMFIEKQIVSILSELHEIDEVIVVDDCSSDGTLAKLEKFNDNRIKIHKNINNIGPTASFDKAISLARNDFVFLSDQDDIWTPGRVDLMIRYLEASEAMLLTSNFTWIDDNEISAIIEFDGVSANQSNNYVKNIIDIFIGKTNYFGCAMLFRKELIKIISPIPSCVESHDLYIAMAANIMKANCHIDEETFLKRKHKTNVTSTVSDRPLVKKLHSRLIFFISGLVIFKRIWLKNN